MKHRDVDIVIKDDKDMDDFLTLITWSMKSINNSRDSACYIFKQLRKTRLNAITTEEFGPSNDSGTERSNQQQASKLIKLVKQDKHAVL